jgi:hypothetical protein
MSLESINFIMEGSASGLESFHHLPVDSATLVKYRVVTPRGGSMPYFFIRTSEIAILIL